MTTDLVNQSEQMSAQTLEQVLIKGNLTGLNSQQKVSYMLKVCQLVGLNPMTKPFEFLTLNGREVLYAKKDCTDQLRKVNGISVYKIEKEKIDDLFVVTAYAKDKSGREDSAIGAVSINGLKGDALANAMMKGETKAKRRVTLSLSGLGLLDESEVETIATKPNPVYPEQPGPNDGVRDWNTGVYVIPQGQWSMRKVTDIPYADARKEMERLEMMPHLEHWQMVFLDRLKEYVTFWESQNPEPGEETKVRPLCTCGSDLKYSDRKGVYYCPNFKDESRAHIKPMTKEDYEK